MRPSPRPPSPRGPCRPCLGARPTSRLQPAVPWPLLCVRRLHQRITEEGTGGGGAWGPVCVRASPRALPVTEGCLEDRAGWSLCRLLPRVLVPGDGPPSPCFVRSRVPLAAARFSPPGRASGSCAHLEPCRETQYLLLAQFSAYVALAPDVSGLGRCVPGAAPCQVFPLLFPPRALSPYCEAPLMLPSSLLLSFYFLLFFVFLNFF